MRIAQACAAAALIGGLTGMSGVAFAQTQTTTPGQLNESGVLPGTNNPNNGGPGSNLSGAVSGNGGIHRRMHEGRASTPDEGARTHNLTGTAPNGNSNGNNMTRNNGG